MSLIADALRTAQARGEERPSATPPRRTVPSAPISPLLAPARRTRRRSPRGVPPVLWGSGALFAGALAGAVGLVSAAPRAEPEATLAVAAPAPEPRGRGAWVPRAPTAAPAGAARAGPPLLDAPLAPASVPDREAPTPTALEPAPPPAVEDRPEPRLRLVLEPAAEGAARTDDAGAGERAPAARLDAVDAAARVNLANRLLEAGRLPEARSALEEALRTDPRLAEAHYALGRVLEAAGDGSAAAAEYRLFLRHAAGRWPQLEAAVHERVGVLDGG